ncbi:hypothetical protein HELRODRAFT_72632 [Helobdella robusta]|uniref:Probable RNA-binding protein EIF1AD n=1 Tax=Helobdella robusta TaxID=6412 RepID=T1G130_HELRO|nr:hypothetical protein HELRODRAFT_72632 [Helobdella robusta]ESO10610.1 hypothetical protein HELRODRAFT_72632 [Helobdella robusta]
MSQFTKRKHVFKEVHEEYVLPDERNRIAKVLAANLGNNLHRVQLDGGEVFLASMPKKFRNNIYIKKDDFVLITPIAEGDKVKGEIATILLKPQIRYIAEQNLWLVSWWID